MAFELEKITGAFLYHIWATGKFFIKFGQEEHTGKLKYSLYSTNYCEGILVIFQAMSILTVRFHQELTAKIDLRFFWLKLEFLWICKVLDIFLVFSNIGRKGFVPGTVFAWHVALPVVPGVVSRSGSFGTRGVTGVCPGKAHTRHVSHSEASGEYHSWNSRRTRRLPGGSYRLGYSEHVAYSLGTWRILSAWHSV